MSKVEGPGGTGLFFERSSWLLNSIPRPSAGYAIAKETMHVEV